MHVRALLAGTAAHAYEVEREQAEEPSSVAGLVRGPSSATGLASRRDRRGQELGQRDGGLKVEQCECAAEHGERIAQETAKGGRTAGSQPRA